MNKYFNLINFVIFQVIWFVLILGKNDYLFIALLLLGLHFYLVKDAVNELKLVGIITALGTLVDSVLAHAEVFVFNDPIHTLMIPLWLLVVWSGFAITLTHSLSYFHSRFWLSVCAGMVGGPASYLAGERLGAVAFSHSTLITALCLGVLWAILFPLSIGLAKQSKGVSTKKYASTE